MKIIRKSKQKVSIRSTDNREVRIIFSRPVQPYDYLLVTHSKQRESNGSVCVNFHSHPNALELILFQKTGSLEINGTRHHFGSGDMVILEPQDIHGAQNLTEHSCLCILLGEGEPKKRPFEET